MKRLAAQEASGGEEAPAPEAVLQKGQTGVLRTGGGEAAGAGEEGRDPALVDAEERHHEARHPARSRRSRTPESKRKSSDRSAGKSEPPASGFRWMIRSRAGSWPRSFHRR